MGSSLIHLIRTDSNEFFLMADSRGWCTGKTQREGVGRVVGGGIGRGNTYKSMADSCQCMAKPTTIL